ncbi:MAG: serine protease [Verrucomicrobiota bacterium]
MNRLCATALCLLTLTPIATADEATERLVLATYKLFNDSSVATGFIIKKDEASFVVTADHVLRGMKGQEMLLVARRKNDNGSYRREDVPVPIRRDGKDLWIKHKKHDLAVLQLPDEIDEPGLPFEVLADDSGMKVGDELRATTFPERFEANGAGFPTLRGGFVASFPLGPHNVHPTFLIDMTSWGGDSGGPAILANSDSETPTIVGIVVGKHQITDSSKESRYVEKKTHYPLNISYAVHASFARQMILDLTKDES